MILVFSEKAEIAFQLLSKGRELAEQLNTDLGAAVLTGDTEPKTEDYIAYGANTIFLSTNPLLKHFSALIYAKVLHQIVKTYGGRIVLIGSTRRGKELAARLAQKLTCGCITNAIAIKVENQNLQVDRYALAGNTIATEQILSPIKIIAVLPYAFEKTEKIERKGQIINVQLALEPEKTKLIEKREKKGENVNLEDAETIIGVGKGFTKKEDLQLAADLAKLLNAEIGCTRPLATDFHWLSEEREIGLSARKVSPKLYVSIGISGQIQHTVGIMRSKVIVAIDRNSDAPIFKVADYGIVGDLYKVVPVLIEKLKQYKSQS